MKVIKNGNLTNYGNLIYCLECKSKEGYVLEPLSRYDIYYCRPCIEKKFNEYDQ